MTTKFEYLIIDHVFIISIALKTKQNLERPWCALSERRSVVCDEMENSTKRGVEVRRFSAEPSTGGSVTARSQHGLGVGVAAVGEEAVGFNGLDWK